MARPRKIKDQALLAAARRVFMAGGVNATTRQVAEAADISEALLFQRYRNKKTLFFAAMLPRPPALDVLIGLPPPQGAAAARRHLVEIAERLMTWLDAALPGLLAAVAHADFPDALGAAHAPAGTNAIARAIAERLTLIHQRGDIAPLADVNETVAVFIDVLHGRAMVNLTGGQEATARQRAEQAVNVIWTGLRPE